MYNNLKKATNCHIFDTYEKLTSRHKEIIDWTIRSYADIERKADQPILITTYLVSSTKNESFKLVAPFEQEIKRRKLENLDVLDFDFGLRFLCNDQYLPFFTQTDTALFKVTKAETGDMCLVKFKVSGTYWLCFMEDNGFFDLNGDYLDDGQGIDIIGVLVNIEMK